MVLLISQHMRDTFVRVNFRLNEWLRPAVVELRNDVAESEQYEVPIVYCYAMRSSAKRRMQF